MPFLQTTYNERMDPARPGMLHGTDNDTFTGIVGYDVSDLPLELAYPRAVTMANGVGGVQPIIAASGVTANNFAGITVRDVTLLNALNDAAGDVYVSGQNAAVLRRGSIWCVALGGAAVIGAAATCSAEGVIMAVGGAVTIPGSRWLTRAAQDGFAILHLTGQKA